MGKTYMVIDEFGGVHRSGVPKDVACEYADAAHDAAGGNVDVRVVSTDEAFNAPDLLAACEWAIGVMPLPIGVLDDYATKHAAALAAIARAKGGA